MIIHDIEQGTDEWFALRAGLPTASNFKKLVTSDGKRSTQINGYIDTLAAEKFCGKPVDAWRGNAETEHGNETEGKARAWYQFQHDVDVAQTGFITDDAVTMGCSPDGLIGSAGLLEIKCLTAGPHVRAMMYIDQKQQCPTDFYQQVQGQMMIAERQWCDILFYHEELPPVVFRVLPDKELHTAITERVREVTDKVESLVKTIRKRAA